MKTSVFLLLIGTCFIICSCSNENLHHLNKGDIVTFELKINEQIQLEMEENRTTDVRHFWLNEHDCMHVDLISEVYNQDPDLMGNTGVGGNVVYTFQAKTSGVDTLIFGNRLDHYVTDDHFEYRPGEDMKIILKISDLSIDG